MLPGSMRSYEAIEKQIEGNIYECLKFIQFPNYISTLILEA